MEALGTFFGRLFQPDKSPGIDKPIAIEFYNRQATKLLLWIEPFCIDIELDPANEYRIESSDAEYRIEFDGSTVTLYLNFTGPKIYERLYSTDFKNRGIWKLTADYSD